MPSEPNPTNICAQSNDVLPSLVHCSSIHSNGREGGRKGGRERGREREGRRGTPWGYERIAIISFDSLILSWSFFAPCLSYKHTPIVPPIAVTGRATITWIHPSSSIQHLFWWITFWANRKNFLWFCFLYLKSLIKVIQQKSVFFKKKKSLLFTANLNKYSHISVQTAKGGQPEINFWTYYLTSPLRGTTKS